MSKGKIRPVSGLAKLREQRPSFVSVQTYNSEPQLHSNGKSPLQKNPDKVLHLAIKARGEVEEVPRINASTLSMGDRDREKFRSLR